MNVGIIAVIGIVIIVGVIIALNSSSDKAEIKKSNSDTQDSSNTSETQDSSNTSNTQDSSNTSDTQDSSNTSDTQDSSNYHEILINDVCKVADNITGLSSGLITVIVYVSYSRNRSKDIQCEKSLTEKISGTYKLSFTTQLETLQSYYDSIRDDIPNTLLEYIKTHHKYTIEKYGCTIAKENFIAIYPYHISVLFKNDEYLYIEPSDSYPIYTYSYDYPFNYLNGSGITMQSKHYHKLEPLQNELYLITFKTAKSDNCYNNSITDMNKYKICNLYTNKYINYGIILNRLYAKDVFPSSIGDCRATFRYFYDDVVALLISTKEYCKGIYTFEDVRNIVDILCNKMSWQVMHRLFWTIDLNALYEPTPTFFDDNDNKYLQLFDKGPQLVTKDDFPTKNSINIQCNTFQQDNTHTQEYDTDIINPAVLITDIDLPQESRQNCPADWKWPQTAANKIVRIETPYSTCSRECNVYGQWNLEKCKYNTILNSDKITLPNSTCKQITRNDLETGKVSIIIDVNWYFTNCKHGNDETYYDIRNGTYKYTFIANINTIEKEYSKVKSNIAEIAFNNVKFQLNNATSAGCNLTKDNLTYEYPDYLKVYKNDEYLIISASGLRLIETYSYDYPYNYINNSVATIQSKHLQTIQTIPNELYEISFDFKKRKDPSNCTSSNSVIDMKVTKIGNLYTNKYINFGVIINTLMNNLGIEILSLNDCSIFIRYYPKKTNVHLLLSKEKYCQGIYTFEDIKNSTSQMCIAMQVWSGKGYKYTINLNKPYQSVPTFTDVTYKSSFNTFHEGDQLIKLTNETPVYYNDINVHCNNSIK